MASILARIGEPEEALTELDTAIRLNPNLLEYRAKKGAALNQLGRHADALAEFEFVIEADPKFFTRWTGRLVLPRYEASRLDKIADMSTVVNHSERPLPDS